MKFSHDLIEKNTGLMIILVILTVSVGGLIEIVPLYFQRSTTEPVAFLAIRPPFVVASKLEAFSPS